MRLTVSIKVGIAEKEVRYNVFSNYVGLGLVTAEGNDYEMLKELLSDMVLIMG